MPRVSIIPVAEIWFQTNGDLSNAFNILGVRARVHSDIVPREALIVAIEEILHRLKNQSDKLLIKESDQRIILEDK